MQLTYVKCRNIIKKELFAEWERMEENSLCLAKRKKIRIMI